MKTKSLFCSAPVVLAWLTARARAAKRLRLDHSFIAIVILAGSLLPCPRVCGAGADEPVCQLIQRVVPHQANRFLVELIPADTGRDVFEIESRAGKVVLRGNNGVSVAAALNWYLKYHCACHHSFTGGSQMRLPNPLPEVTPKVRRVSTARYRYFLNYCCFGYSLPWFDWDQWEKLIDWMALNGINLPLAVTGQEAVWEHVAQRLGWPKPDLDSFLAGPPYLPFGWMGCLDGHGGPLPATWGRRHAELEKRILERQRSLGMTPVLQGFTGHVPPVIVDLFPTAKVQKITWLEWNTYLLDPVDPLFRRIADVFVEEETRLFGTDHFYASDTFIEMIPPSGDTNYLADLGRAIFEGMTRTDSQATWVLQGWPFYFNRDFWTQPRIEAALAPVPDDRILLLDLYCEKTPVWNRTGAFCGKPWLWCNIQNFGNRTWLGGPLDLINRDLFAARQDPQARRLSGLGFVNEGLDNNPVVFDLLFELAWREEPVALDSWLDNYSRRAYGKLDPHAAQAWRTLHETVFQDAFDNPVAYTAAPSLAAPRGTPYRNDRLAEAWQHLLAAADNLHGADPFQFDLVNVTRQVLGNYASELHRRSNAAFRNGDRTALRQAAAQMLTLIRDLDALLATRPEFLLGPWLEDARRWGATDRERDRLEWNARRVLTLWGNTPVLRDYAGRQWSGLLTGFYLARWELFYGHLDRALVAGKVFDEKAYAAELLALEQRWSDRHDRYPSQPRGNSIAQSRQLWARYSEDLKPKAFSLTNSLPVPLYQCQRIDRDLVLSGKVDDPLWRQADVIRLNNPIDGQPGRYLTTARMLYSARCLYLAFECEDEYVWGTLTNRDAAIFGEECVEAFICPSGKIRQYYELNVSPRNTVFDAFILNGRPTTGEWTNFRTWKEFTCEGMVTRVYVQGELGVRGARGWSAEYAIPFSAIIGSDSLSPKPGDEWRLNLYRIDSPEPKRLEYYAWSPTGANDFHRPQCFGILKFTK